MRRRKNRRSRRRRTAPSVSIAGYTRLIDLSGTAAADGSTILVTADVADVTTPATETVNRKILSVSGQAFFAASLQAGKYAAAQFCLWAHPEHEDWPSVADYDPFKQGPGETGFEGMLAPRPFCRRTFVQSIPATGSSQTISAQHRIRSRAERLLRPGWKLTAGLYLRGDSASVVRHTSLLRTTVAG